ncbi:hydroxymethylglutaryl-CoA lyase [Salinicola acroporae]|uniref:hydroxymethylglutaryl-CoA lyase n=1 Tax=Salinicola acroporae TaxID=1541440 RepID=UPI000DA14823|nr:hydroxymethylglutaryl-CoA lyase [Salinicola acroporae]
MTARESVRLVEVAARDGLQNEPEVLPVAMRVELLERLADTGLRHLEAGAFVSPRWVPQMQQTQDVLSQLNRRPNISYSVLVPNSKGFEFARAAGVDEIAVFTAASEAFAHHNINCSIAESLARFEPIMPLAAQAGIRVRGYISCVLGCPYTGDVDPQKVSTLARHLLDMGCYEVSLGDTTGIGTPRHTRELIEACARQLPVGALAGHFHDTWGMAVANVQAALEAGIRVFDGSVSALGGCPYAPGATGNVATESLVRLLESQGFDTGIDLERLVDVAEWVDRTLSRRMPSPVARAIRANRGRGDHLGNQQEGGDGNEK